MIFNKKLKRLPVISGARLHTLTLVVHTEFAFAELEGRKEGREAKSTQWVADNRDKRSKREGETSTDAINETISESEGINERNVKLIKN